MSKTTQKLHNQCVADNTALDNKTVLELMSRLQAEFSSATHTSLLATIENFAKSDGISLAERVALLSSLHNQIARLLSKLMEPSLPNIAPARWTKRVDRDETPADFIAREYRQYIGHGLTRAHIRQLDFGLYKALCVWLQTNELPADLPLPTKKERNDALIANTLTALEDNPLTREAQRLRNVVRYREHKKRSTGPT